MATQSEPAAALTVYAREEACGGCVYFRDQKTDARAALDAAGECRRYPPFRDITQQWRAFPMVLAGDWCGEYEARRTYPLNLPRTGEKLDVEKRGG